MLKSPFSVRKPEDFRILLFYPNLHMSALMPQSIGIFTAILKAQGYTLELFDCTYYEDIDEINLGRNTTEEKLDNKQVRKHNDSEWERKGAKKKIGIKEDFLKKIRDFKPDLIICSVLESTYYLAIQLLEAVPKNEVTYKTIFGGVFATYAPEICISTKVVDYVCKGEGEEAIKEFCEKLITGDRIDNVRNFLIKSNGNVYRNNLRNAVDIDTIPIPDWDLFDKGSIYRPMQGKIYRAVGFETQRGCPYTCTFCNSPSNNVIYKSETKKIFHRKKSIKRMKEELDFLVKKYNPELIYMVVDTFLAMSERDFDEFKEMYLDYKIPFWMNTRAETINEHRAKGLEEMNMLRTSIGVEHGNTEYRKKYLKRNVSDEVQIKAFEILADHKYVSCANAIIGMPDENRDLIFDTINFMRKLPEKIDATGAFIWAPYHGTPLRELAIEKGYIDKDVIASISNTAHSMLNMPSITKEEITGLGKTFSYYVKFPKDRWKEIEVAEKDSEEGKQMHKKLSIEFDQKYRFETAKMPDLH
jgi:anaerobic magnesium-protoporphyrin IX monomethyl ester cyclase